MPQLNVPNIPVFPWLFVGLLTLLLAGGIGLPLASLTAAETAISAPSEQLTDEELAVQAETLRQTQPQLFAGAKGILVTEVVPDSQAVTAGLARGDILLSYAGRPLNTIEDLTSLVRQQAANTKVNLDFLRNEQSLTRTLRSGLIGVALAEIDPPGLALDQLQQQGTSAIKGGDAEGALALWEQGLRQAQALDRPTRSGQFLTLIGFAHEKLGRLDTALQHYGQARSILQQIGDLSGERTCLDFMAEVHQAQGDYGKALLCYQDALKLARQENKPVAERGLLVKIAKLHTASDQFELALEQYQAALSFAETTENWPAEEQKNIRARLNTLGKEFLNQKQPLKAIATFELALAIDLKLADKTGESIRRFRLGKIHQNLQQSDRAADHFTLGLAIDRANGDRDGERLFLSRLGDVYYEQQQYQQALQYYQQVLTVKRETGKTKYLGVTLYDLIRTCEALGDYHQALPYYEQKLALEEEDGDLKSQDYYLGKILKTAMQLKRYDKVLEFADRMLAVKEQRKDPKGRDAVLQMMGVAYALASPDQLTTKDAAGRTPRLAVFPLRNATTEAELDWLSIGLQDSLTGDLWYLSGLNTQALPSFRPKLAERCADDELACVARLELKDWQTIAAAEQYDGFIWGEYRLKGEQLQVTLTRYGGEDRTPQQTVTFAGPLAELPQQASSNLLQLMVDREMPLLAEEQARVVAPKTASAAAFEQNARGFWWQQRYTAAEEAQRTEMAGHWSKCLEKAVQLDPRYAAVWNNLGWMHLTRGDASAAATAFRRALAIKPQLIDAKVGIALAEKEPAPLAEAVALNPSLSSHLLQLALMEERQGNRETAIRHYRQLLQIAPDSYLAWAHLGDNYLNSGQAEEAAKCFAVALKSPATQLRSTCTELLGKTGSRLALFLLAKGLEDPEPEVGKAAAAALAQLGMAEAVPFLGKALEDEEIQIQVAEALDQLAPQILPRLVADLNSDNFQLRSTAAVSLGILRSTAAVAPLLKALTDSEPQMRSQAAMALGRIGAAASIDGLVAALQDTELAVRYHAARALGSLGFSAAIPGLMTLLEDEIAEVRGEAAASLGKLLVQQEAPRLSKLLDDEHPLVRTDAARALSRIAVPETLPALVAALQDPQWAVRTMAAHALGVLARPEATPALIAALEDDDENVRLITCNSLGRIGDVRAETPLMLAFETAGRQAHQLSNSLEIQEQAVWALGEIGTQAAFDFLATVLKGGELQLRSRAAIVLAESGSAATIPTLFEALLDPDPDIRGDATYALIDMCSRQTRPLFLAALQNNDPRMRRVAAQALSAVGGGSDLELLIRALDDEDDEVRATIATTLGELAMASAVPPLINALKDAEADVRENAARALGKIGDDAAIPHLQEALQQPDPEMRAAAAWALYELEAIGAISPLFQTLQANNPTLDRGDTAERLGKLDMPGSLADLLRLLRSAEAEQRSQAAHLLGLSGASEAIQPLVTALRDESWSVRYEAATALVKFDPTAVLPKVETVFVEADASGREYLIDALGDAGATWLLPLLRRAMGDEATEVRRSAAQKLSNMEPSEALPLLIAAMDDPEPPVREAAAYALGNIGLPEGAQALIQALQEPTTIQSTVITALGQIGSTEAVPALIQALHGNDSYVVGAAVEALGNMRVTAAVPELIRLLSDLHDSIRAKAAKALGQIGAAEAVPALILALKNDDSYVVGEAVEALGRIGRPEAVPHLVAALAGRNRSYFKFGDDPSLPMPFMNNDLFAVLPESFMEQLSMDLIERRAALFFSAIDRTPPYSKNALALVCFTALSDVYKVRLNLLGKLHRYDAAKDAVDGALLARDLDDIQQQMPQPKLAENPYLSYYTAHLLKEKGRHQEALDWAERALQTCGQAGDVPVEILLRWLRAETLWRLGRPAEALSELGRVEKELLPAVTAFERRHTDLPFAAYTLALKGIVQGAAGQANAGVLSLYQAEQRLLDSLEVGDKVKGRLQKIILAYRARTQMSAAKQDADAVIKAAEELPAQTALERDAEEVALLTRIQAAVGEGDYELAHKLMERLSLKRLARAPQGGEMVPASVQRRAACDRINQLQGELARLERQIAQAESQKSDKEAQDGNQSAINKGQQGDSHTKLRSRRRAVQRELKKYIVSLKRSHPEVATLVGAEPLEVSRLQEQLTEDQAIVQYLMLQDKTLIFLITAADIQILEAASGSRRIGRKVRQFRAALQQPQDQGSGEIPGSDWLSRILIGPLLEEINDYRQLIIVPNGVLHALPFEALRVDDKFVAERWVLSYLSSSSLVAVADHGQPPANKLFALANPSHPDWSALPGAEREVAAISALFTEKKVFSGREATRATLLGQDLQGWTLHLAMHGETGTAERTRLVLSDGYLTVPEIWGLALDGSPMVVLSACETGLGEHLSGDEVVSLANGFFFSGAGSVVSSLWKVPDVATRTLIQHFYEHLHAGTDRAEALTLAKRDLLNDPEWQAPAFWAGFVLNGL